MLTQHALNKKFLPFLIGIIALLPACKKLVAIDEPINSLTSTEIFATDDQANSAMAAVYSQMINNNYSWFSSGLMTEYPGFSADEFNSSEISTYIYSQNRLTRDSSSWIIWNTPYTTIYNANAVIEGIAASTAATLHDSLRQRLTGEAKFVRALAYFYLTNLYGDVPMVLTIDFNKTTKLSRMPQAQVYQQIVSDLKDAQSALAADYSVAGGERIRPNKMAATALLARVYLYTKDYPDAAAQASTVIGNSSHYTLVNDPNGVFLKNSTEAIWQLQQNISVPNQGNATGEGLLFLPNPLNTGVVSTASLTDQLLTSFEPGDLRRQDWVDSTIYGGITYYFPYKYKVGAYNHVDGGEATEYYMVLRLAEQYLIRAEAEANGAPGGAAAAIQDLDVIRTRAGLPALPASLAADQLAAAIAHERQIELFAEWGHRWLDLKRTGQAHAVLSVLPGKQPWHGDYQLLYPIPTPELQSDPNLTQNPGY
ncbi:MAG TPA: RagB/SusD family nutrient uptake outer membrane protein [Puia sp.]|jgi:hypothetical protein|nr:RagB/SusD family nutrient uptake outer membrane protein [Puia sp.]